MDAGLKKVLIGMAAGALGLATVGCGGDSAEAEETTIMHHDDGSGGEGSCGAGSCGGDMGGGGEGGGDVGGEGGGDEGGEGSCGAGSCGGE